MGRPKVKTLKKLIFNKYYINLDLYKKTVVTFQLRFDYHKQSNEIIDLSIIKGETEHLFQKEFELVNRQRNIFEIELPETMQQPTGRCSLNCYFMKIDDYEEYVVEHCKNLMQDIERLFNSNDIEIINPNRTNKYTKTY